jgi:hypothetical protein
VNKHQLPKSYRHGTAVKRLKEEDSLFPPLRFPDSIRILTLQPAENENDQLVCRLLARRIKHEAGAYEALSYVWGDKNGSANIHCNGAPLNITRNLEDALRKIRLEKEPRYLWVDAICINQEDVHERGHQVRLMRSIYSCSMMSWERNYPARLQLPLK